MREGHVAANPAELVAGPDSPLRRYVRTYGKVQARNPGRWLSHDEAFGQLVGGCQDGTIIGLRDEIVLRLGLLGLRASEIVNLNIGSLRRDGSHTIDWTGKGHKPRTAIAGPALVTAVNGYLQQYPHRTPDSPLIVPQVLGAQRQGGPARLNWGNRTQYRTIFHIIASRGAAAGLGHVAPHDLRRTAAGILHNSKDEAGAHHFDLLDIQKVLGHSDPATTMRSYLDPLDTEVIGRAASVLD
jgi:integrase